MQTRRNSQDIKEEDGPHKHGDRKSEISNQKVNLQRSSTSHNGSSNPRFISQFSDIVNDRNKLI